MDLCEPQQSGAWQGGRVCSGCRIHSAASAAAMLRLVTRLPGVGEDGRVGVGCVWVGGLMSSGASSLCLHHGTVIAGGINLAKGHRLYGVDSLQRSCCPSIPGLCSRRCKGPSQRPSQGRRASSLRCRRQQWGTRRGRTLQ